MVEEKRPQPGDIEGSNPYATPEAVVDDIPEDDLEFYAASNTKLIVLSLLTVGFFQLVWFYRNYEKMKRRRNDSSWPVFRALFSGLWYFHLAGQVKSAAVHRGVETGLIPALLGLGYLAGNVVWNLPPPLSLIGYVSVFLLVPVNSLASRVNAASSEEAAVDGHFGVAAWLAIVFGGLFTILVVIGSFLPQPT